MTYYYLFIAIKLELGDFSQRNCKRCTVKSNLGHVNEHAVTKRGIYHVYYRCKLELAIHLAHSLANISTSNFSCSGYNLYHSAVIVTVNRTNWL